MSIDNPLSTWKFLLGKWESVPESHIGDPPDTINKVKITEYPNDKYFMLKSEGWRDGVLTSNGLAVMYYDYSQQKFKMKAFFEYGFVNNYTEYESSDREIKFETETESPPKGFESTRFRQYLRKESDTRFTITLDTATKNEDFKKFYESTYEKTH
ncbi:MAG: DUF1579 domain-containing protein [Promethearchaeota archaeon]|nr:MAG: DUF1579 domain-containing protein [Candidatus Lokiarchaeota archaeon]